MLALAALAAPAVATTGLAWKWDVPHRYDIQVEVALAEQLVLRKDQNAEAHIRGFGVRLVTTCAATGSQGKAVVLGCAVDDVAFTATPVPSSVGRVVEVLDEMDAKLTGHALRVVLTNDGKVRSVELDGVAARDDRARQNNETLRLVMTRAVAALDLELPAKGDDKGRAAWDQSTPLAVGFPSTAGAFGQVAVTHTLTKADGALVTIQSLGHGNVGSGEMVKVGADGADQPANLFDVQLKGWCNFDTAMGAIVGRAYHVEGVASASSMLAQAGTAPPYVQDLKLTLIKPEDPAPQLDPNAETAATAP